MRPVARREGLLLRELPEELLVYDRATHRAHCLNRTAAAVFRRADGSRTVDDLAALLSPGDRESGQAMAGEALARLADAGLLEAGAEATGQLSRRDVVRRVGIGAALLLPAVASIVAPTPAEAAATCTDDCIGKADGTPCSCFGADPCTATCVSDACSDGGGC
jgi:hypothetical protein